MSRIPSRRLGGGWLPDPLVIRARLLSRVVRPTPPSFALGLVVGACLIALETVAVVVLQRVGGESLGGFGLCYMFGVLVVSAVWGVGLSLTMTLASAIAFGFFHAHPYSDFSPFTVDDWLAVGVFLVVALLASSIAAQVRVGERFFDLSSDLMCITGADNIIRVNPACKRILGYSDDEIASRPWIDFVVPDDREQVRAVFDQLAGSSEAVQYANRVICRDGSHRSIEWSVVWFRGIFYAVGRDVSERHTKEDQLRTAHAVAEARGNQLRTLAEQQAALRRVATLVARGASPSEVFTAVAAEVANTLQADNAVLVRYHDDGLAELLAMHHTANSAVIPVPSRWSLDGDNVAAMVLRSGRTARMDTHEHADGAVAAFVRQLGICSGVGAPVVVNGRLWGATIIAFFGPDPPPSDTEARLAEFADLVATAIANAATRDELIATRDELIASRARIVAAADDARRRLERDLHDGAQQRLVSLGMELRLAEQSMPPELQSFRTQLSGIVSGLNAVSSDLQEISRGIHPAILSDGGVGPALKTLARRCPIPANVDVLVEGRLPESIEVAAYYVVAEALTNAVKYSQATGVKVCAEIKEGNLCLSVQDDGIGGADSREGSGLIGLKDRVEVLGGNMNVISPPGIGTSLHATIPLNG